ncbi:hypothetical protein C812_03394 [Paenibacillus barengoltzii G22]|uniref:Uncharacterized protein n=1 Tax=Paenibacillus barengoltzii G22 TaxID=1235795 RepID=R9L735_9BACL|nr:hypothetical protein C812_03394 [Paenibacillus barengoltzii G22]
MEVSPSLGYLKTSQSIHGKSKIVNLNPYLEVKFLNKNNKLRIVWIIPNVLLYLFFIGIGTFVLWNVEGLKEINQLGLWGFVLFLLLLINLWGSYRIWSWMRKGKI